MTIKQTSVMSFNECHDENIINSQINQILAYIRAHPMCVRCQIAEGLEIEKSSVAARVNHLLHEGKLIEELEPVHYYTKSGHSRSGYPLYATK